MFVKKVITFLAALTFSMAALADPLVFALKEGKDHYRLRLTDEVCTDKTIIDRINQLTGGMDLKIQKGSIIWANEHFEACGFIYGKNVFMIGTDLDPVQPVPLSAFTEEKVI